MSTSATEGVPIPPHKPPLIVAWITTNALGSGVFTALGEPFDYGGGRWWFIVDRKLHGGRNYPPGDWHRTEEAARTAVLKMIAAEQRRLMRSFNHLAVLDADVKAGWMPMVKGKTKPVERPSRRRV